MSEVDSNHLGYHEENKSFKDQTNKEIQSNQHDNRVVYVNSSDQFQNMQISRSQQFSHSFNDLVDQSDKRNRKYSHEEQKVRENTNEHQEQRQTHQQAQKVNHEKQQKQNNQKPAYGYDNNIVAEIKQPQITSLFGYNNNDSSQTGQKTIQNQSQFHQSEPTASNQSAAQPPKQQQQHIIPAQQITQTIVTSTLTGNEHRTQQQTTEQVQVSNIITQQTTQPQILQQSTIKQKQVDYEGLVSLHIFQKKINKSIEFKNKGNQHFKVNSYQDAIKMYSEGLRILDPKEFYGATKAECEKMVEVSASLLFNIGSCFYKMGVWKSAEVYFSQTITINPNHIKALHNRARCRYETQNYQGAMNDIKLAFSKDKTNVEVYQSYQKILQKYNEQMKKQKESLKQMSSKIFRKDSQKSLTNSQKQQQNKLVVNEKKEQKQDEQKHSDLWAFAPIVLVAGAALFFGYKKWFGK